VAADTDPVPDPIDPSADDFDAEPWRYPGTRAPGSGLLVGRRYLRLTPEAVQAAAGDRHLLVTAGSNASPAVLLRKLAGAGAEATVPFICGEASGLHIGHSAHVSRAGYLAAAPMLDPTSRTPVVAILLDDEQLECVDRTEPNYLRRSVTRDTCRLTLEGGETPASFLLYESRRGLLGPPGQRPLGLMDQDRLYAMLRHDCAPFARLLAADDDRAGMRRFASDERLRGLAMQAFRSARWVVASGLGQVSPGRRAPSTDAPPR
jgi:hypothetical protein